MKDIDQIRRENLISESVKLGGDSELARALGGVDKNQIYQWLRAPAGPQRRNMRKTTARAVEKKLGLEQGWLDKDHSADSGQVEPAAIPMFTPERRATDNVIALQLAVESLAAALLRKSRGSAGVFSADLDVLCDKKKFSKDHALLGRLFGIAAEVQSIEAEEARDQRRAGLAGNTKP